MNVLRTIDSEIVYLKPTDFIGIIVYVDKKLNDKSNHQTLIATIKYIKNAQQLQQVIF